MREYKPFKCLSLSLPIYLTVIPYFCAIFMTASEKDIFSYSITNLMAFPLIPQPKHLKIFFAEDTTKDGVLSL